LSCNSSAVKIFDLSDEAVETDTDGYLVPHLYVTAIAVGETVYKLPFESLKKLLIRLQRGDAFI